jgi:hypothetical protein
MSHATRGMSKSKQLCRPNLKSNLTSWGATNTVTIHHRFFFLLFNVYIFQCRKTQRFKNTSHLIFRDFLGKTGNKNNDNNSKSLQISKSGWPYKPLLAACLTGLSCKKRQIKTNTHTHTYTHTHTHTHAHAHVPMVSICGRRQILL